MSNHGGVSTGLLVVVETTALTKDVWAASTPWELLLTLARRGHVQVVVPEVVLGELDRQFREALVDGQTQLRQLRALLPPRARGGLDLGDLDVAARRRDEALRARLGDALVTVAPVPQVTQGDVLARDLSGRRPFQRSG